MRHEKFNGKMKGFWLMKVEFLSPDDEAFSAAFEAISVLVHYILKHGGSFFDIMAGIEME